jgi:isocitrate/isopropylmalate dehydrogenase
MMLRHLSEPAAANAVESAVERVLRDGSHVTRDLGGNAGTTEMTDALVGAIGSAIHP